MGFLAASWNETQILLYNAKVYTVNALVAALVTVLTQYAISEWIWYGDKGDKRQPHRAPVFLVSGVFFIYFWSTIFNKYMGYAPLAYAIATPILAFGGAFVNLAFCWIWTMMFPATDYDDDDDDSKNNENDAEPVSPEVVATDEKQEAKTLEQDMEAPAQTTDVSATATPSKPKKSKPKVLYINNIKIFLTVLVVVHHSCTMMFENETMNDFISDSSGFVLASSWQEYFTNGGWSFFFFSYLMGTSQSYFMSLFFFFSGYFVPKSLDKKGTRGFLMGRSRRIGIPLMFVAFFGMGMQHVLELALFSRGKTWWVDELSHNFIYDLGHVWFLCQLMFFGVVYAFVCGEGWSPKVRCPSLLQFFGISVTLGLCGLFLTMILPSEPLFMGVPMSPPIYPPYVLFFFGGAVAQRNNWMEEIKSKSRLAIYSWAFFSWVVFVGYSGFIWMRAWYFGIVDFHLDITTGFFICGYLSIPFSLGVTVFFMDFLNKKYFFTDFFAVSMYTVYIIHRHFIIIGLYFWYLIMEATNNVISVTEGSAFKSGLVPTVYVIPANMVVAGFFFLFAFTMITVWPVAYGIRSIPGFSKVL